MTMRPLIGLALLATATFGAQVASAQAGATAPDPARLAAARQVVDLALPPENRAAMLQQMTAAMSGSMRRGLLSSPSFKAQLDADPRVKPIVERFFDRTEARTSAQIRTGMPALFDAMVRAYARRFTLPQLADLKTFFISPTGHVYMTQVGTIMADPDVAAAQSSIMSTAMAASQKDVQAMIAELKALPPKPKG